MSMSNTEKTSRLESSRVNAVALNASNDKSWQLQRRELLKMAASLCVLPVSYAFAEESTSRPLSQSIFSPTTFQTLDALSQHFLPKSEFGLGAKEIQAMSYWQQKVSLPDYQDREFLENGIGWLNDFALQEHQVGFTGLNAQQKEALLQQIARSSAGENWLSMVLNDLLEAMLADPIYGGNPNGVGWQAVGHQAGFPRPTQVQTYYRTGYYRRKYPQLQTTKQNFKAGA